MDENLLKIIVVGESNTGKTTLIRKYCCNTFDELTVKVFNLYQ